MVKANPTPKWKEPPASENFSYLWSLHFSHCSYTKFGLVTCHDQTKFLWVKPTPLKEVGHRRTKIFDISHSSTKNIEARVAIFDAMTDRIRSFTVYAGSTMGGTLKAHSFHRAMLRRARYCYSKLSVCPSVCPSVRNVEVLWLHRLEIFKNNFMVS